MGLLKVPGWGQGEGVQISKSDRGKGKVSSSDSQWDSQEFGQGKRQIGTKPGSPHHSFSQPRTRGSWCLQGEVKWCPMGLGK